MLNFKHKTLNLQTDTTVFYHLSILSVYQFLWQMKYDQA